jgi:predicted TIM-barrel fold metal-dependent hydrolase
MSIDAKRDPKVQQIRDVIGHPIVDVDAHQLEFVPVVLQYLSEVAGPAMTERFVAFLRYLRRTFTMTEEQRRDERVPMPVWWPMPTEKTLDRATTDLPKLMHARMDEIGLDFSIVYPGIGIEVVALPGIAEGELRRASARAFNLYYADHFRGLEDRIVPAAVIPMHTPEEAVEELEYAVSELGFKVVLLAGDVLRPISKLARQFPAMFEDVYYSDGFYQDTFGIDSEHDYDPVWAKCIELKVAPTFHSAPIGWATRRSISRHQYNQIGGFADGGESVCKSLFFGGVTRRFPELRIGLLEGGVAWAPPLYSRMIDHWKKRGAEGITHLDPSLLQPEVMSTLIDEYGSERVRAVRDQLVADLLWADRPEELDDWRLCGIEKPEDIRDLFVPNFFFGCEGDDRLNAVAFDTELNPFGVQLGAMFGSDIGHFDVPDMRLVVEEAFELVESNLISMDNFRDFAFANAVRLHGGANPDFFKGTLVEKEAAEVLATDNASSGGPGR